MRVAVPISGLKLGDVLETRADYYVVVLSVYLSKSGMPRADVLLNTVCRVLEGPMHQTKVPGLSLKWEKVARLLWKPLMHVEGLRIPGSQKPPTLSPGQFYHQN